METEEKAIRHLSLAADSLSKLDSRLEKTSKRLESAIKSLDSLDGDVAVDKQALLAANENLDAAYNTIVETFNRITNKALDSIDERIDSIRSAVH